MRRIACLGLLAATFSAVSAPSASATRVLGLPETMNTAHFQLHYSGLGAKPILHQQAGQLAANLERAYTTIVTEWGYPAPLDDGDGKIDVYVTDIAGGALGAAFAGTSAKQTYGWIWIDDSAVKLAETAAHELFHLVQFGIWAPMSPWLLEGTAEWAAFRFLDFPAQVDDGLGKMVPLSETLGAPDMSISCSGAACGLDDYERGGYSRWHFYQYLTERFGNSIVKDIFDKGKAFNDTTLTGIDILIPTLAAKGATLSDTFTDWTVANMTGTYQAAGLKGIAPVAVSTALTGGESGSLPKQTIAVNHLAARYVAFQRGSGTASGPCYAATLTLTVTFPAGLGARPYFHWTEPVPAPPAPPGTVPVVPDRAPAIPLAVSGTTATLSLPWDTCTWKYSGLLSLPNPTAAVDAALFTVSGSITVDKTQVVTSTPPPAGTYTGPTVPAPVVDDAPAIAVYGPETLRVSKKTRVVRVVVFSSGQGELRAEIGGTALGARKLRAGNNDLRYTLPAGVVRSLSARNQLTLTSYSGSGVKGATITRKLVLTK